MCTETKLTYSNPRKDVVITDWPSGSKRVTATFSVDANKAGLERAVRSTTGAPKKLTYARNVVFADGSDGRLYVMQLAQISNFISVMKGTFDYQQETIWPADERYADLIAMFS